SEFQALRLGRHRGNPVAHGYDVEAARGAGVRETELKRAATFGRGRSRAPRSPCSPHHPSVPRITSALPIRASISRGQSRSRTRNGKRDRRKTSTAEDTPI